MPYSRITDARKAVTDAQESARQIAEAQQQKAGFTRSPGFEPAPKARTPYQAEADRPSVPYKSEPLDLSQAGEPKTKKRSFGINE